MKYSTATVSITPNFKIKQAGFLQQTNEISQIHDDLYARIISFQEHDNTIYLISCDNLAFPIFIQNEIKKRCEITLNKKCEVVLSCTHTHFGADPKNENYQNFCIDKISDACINLIYTDGSLEYSYICEPYDEVGKSRISNHKANTLLQILSIFDNKKRVINIITYNCHPTIMNGDTPFFSSEYPGYVLNQLSALYPSEFFTFLQGADGDISTRFTRKSQDYDGVVHLGNLLIKKINSSLLLEYKLFPFTTFNYSSLCVPLTHSLEPINLDNIPSNLSPRELETIEVGIKVREHLLKNLDSLDKEVIISSLKIGDIHFIFEPNELFSFYINAIDVKNSILVCYSNGYSPYVTGFNENFITYEKFTDTLSLDSKKKLFDTITSLSKS